MLCDHNMQYRMRQPQNWYETSLKYYNMSLGKVVQDDNLDPDTVAQIRLNEVLAVVAPSDMAISYSVYMVPCYDNDELNAYKVFSLIKCVDPESI
jgi:hypothetical protein